MASLDIHFPAVYIVTLSWSNDMPYDDYEFGADEFIGLFNNKESAISFVRTIACRCIDNCDLVDSIYDLGFFNDYEEMAIGNSVYRISFKTDRHPTHSNFCHHYSDYIYTIKLVEVDESGDGFSVTRNFVNAKLLDHDSYVNKLEHEHKKINNAFCWSAK